MIRTSVPRSFLFILGAVVSRNQVYGRAGRDGCLGQIVQDEGGVRTPLRQEGMVSYATYIHVMIVFLFFLCVLDESADKTHHLSSSKSDRFLARRQCCPVFCGFVSVVQTARGVVAGSLNFRDPCDCDNHSGHHWNMRDK